jgi:hypothetical protein
MRGIDSRSSIALRCIVATKNDFVGVEKPGCEHPGYGVRTYAASQSVALRDQALGRIYFIFNAAYIVDERPIESGVTLRSRQYVKLLSHALHFLALRRA